MVRFAWEIPWFAIAVMAAFCAPGCGGTPGEHLPVVPVKGKITVKGQPAAWAWILLSPVDKSGLRKNLSPRARCDDQGNFVLTTYDANDGAPSGDYLVSIQWRGPSVEYAATKREEEKYRGPDRLKEKYSEPATSGLKATVGTSATELAPFALP